MRLLDNYFCSKLLNKEYDAKNTIMAGQHNGKSDQQ